MDAGREVAIAVVAQWMRCAHTGTALNLDAGEVTLAWDNPILSQRSGAVPGPAGLVIGPDQRVYHAVPEEGRIVRLPWQPGSRQPADTVAEDLLTPPEPEPAGAFTPASQLPSRRVAAVALAVAADGQLALVDATTGVVLVLDLPDRRLVRRVVLPARALDLELSGDGLVICVDDPAAPLWHLAWRRSPRPIGGGRPAGVPAGSRPARVAVAPDGVLWLLWRAELGSGFVSSAGFVTSVGDGGSGRVLGPVGQATDVEVDGDGAVVVAGPAARELARFVLAAEAVSMGHPMRAPNYDGRGLARTPDGRIAFWNGTGVRTAYPARVRYHPEGRVLTFALDSGTPAQRWGRIFLDACLPAGTELRVASLTGEQLPDTLTPDPGAGRPAGLDPAAVDALPPGPPLPPAQDLLDPDGSLQRPRPVYRRGPVELPWVRSEPAGELVTYEAPVDAAPGRYLWLAITLRGTPAVTPRLRAVRVERAGPRLPDKLPAVYTTEPRAAAFLDRYLTMLAGPLLDADTAAADRHVLLDPAACPPELLPWLASLVGLVLDDRWPELARRRLLARAVPLFRARGTVGALVEMVTILLGVEPVLVERFRFRGVADPTRVGASFEEHAHRFSVVVRGALRAEQDAALRHLLDQHRPAHTVVEVCTAGSARVGLGLHLELTSVIGAGSAFSQLAVGGRLGRDAVLGQPTGAVTIGAGRLGQDARVEP